MHLAGGAAAQYEVALPDCDESVLAVAANPTGSCLAVLSQWHVHFWTCGCDLAHLCSVPLPCVSAEDDRATHILWHPRGERLVVVTLLGRVVFCEVDMDVHSAEVLAPSCYEQTLHIGAAIPHVRFVAEEQIASGMITLLVDGGLDTFFACTNGGVVCILNWFLHKLLRSWNSHCLPHEPQTVARADKCATGNVDISASIIDVQYAVSLRLTALLLSTGSVVLARSSTDSDFARDAAIRAGLCSAETSAVRVAINARHMLLATATYTGEAVCERIAQDLSLSPHWHVLKNHKRSGPVRALEWSPCEEMLCVGLYGTGVYILHCSGVCLFAPPSPSPSSFSPRPSLGCAAVSWDAHGHRFFIATPDARSFVAVTLERIAASPTATAAHGTFVPLAALSGTALRLSSTSPSECLRDAVVLCARYAAENGPLKFAAISADGASVAVAGRCGFALFDCASRRWRTLCDRREECAIVCVAQPLWLCGAAVAVPARVDGARGFALRVYAHRRLDAAALLAQAVLEHQPLLLACCRGEQRDAQLLVVDAANTLSVWRCAFTAPRRRIAVALEFAIAVALPSALLGPVALAAVPNARLRPRGAMLSSLSLSSPPLSSLPVALLVLRGSHALVALDLCATTSAVLLAGGAHSLWVDDSAPVAGAAVLVAGTAGAQLLHLSGAGAAQCRAFAVAEFDEDALPVGLCAAGGCLLAVAAPRAVQSVPYGYRILSARVRRGISSGAVQLMGGDDKDDDLFLMWLERMRASGTFLANVEYFLYTLLTEPLPDGIPAVERRAAFKASLMLLRRYTEFHTIVVSCARKMDPPRHRDVLDVVGAPADIFRECVNQGRLDDAAHLLRFVVLDSGTGAMACAARLLACAVAQLHVSLLDELLRFVALLHADRAEHREGLWQRVMRGVRLHFRPGRAPIAPIAPNVPNVPPPQCRAATAYLLRQHPGAAAAVRGAAAAALFAGRLVALRAVLCALSAPLPVFIAAALRGDAVAGTGTGTGTGRENLADNIAHNLADNLAENLARVLDGVHDEHGLPLGVRRLGPRLEPLAPAPAAGTETDRALWTSAQAALYATPGAAAAMLALREDYGAWGSAVAVINLVLMRTADLTQQLREDSALCQAMEKLTLLPRNAAYHDFVRKCIDSSQIAHCEEDTKSPNNSNAQADIVKDK